MEKVLRVEDGKYVTGDGVTTADKCMMSDGVTSVEDEITSLNSDLTELNQFSSDIFIVLNNVTSARTYYDGQVNIHKEGYLPIYVGYSSSKSNTNVYNLYVHSVNSQWIVDYGVSTTDNSTFSSLTFTLYVRYKKILSD